LLTQYTIQPLFQEGGDGEKQKLSIFPKDSSWVSSFVHGWKYADFIKKIATSKTGGKLNIEQHGVGLPEDSVSWAMILCC